MAGRTGEPAYTVFCETFQVRVSRSGAARRGCHSACRVVDGAGLAQGTVDYVWYTPRTLRVCAVLELVDIAELKRWKLPSKCVGGKAAASSRPSQRIVPRAYCAGIGLATTCRW